MTLPLAPHQPSAETRTAKRGVFGRLPPSRRRCFCVTCDVLYSALILFVVVATANHFILFVAAGAAICGVAWVSNRLLRNLLPIEDYALWVVRTHMPEKQTVGWECFILRSP